MEEGGKRGRTRNITSRRQVWPNVTDFEHGGMGPWASKPGQPLEAEKGTEKYSP